MKLLVDGIDLKLDERCLSNYVKSHIIGIESDYIYEFKLLKQNIMKNYEITEEQIKELAKGNAKVKNWFPEVFETKLEVGKWKKTPANGLYCPKEKTKDGFLCYGVCADSIWREINIPILITKDDVDASDSEVEEALTNEAKKRGLVEGAYFIEPENCNVYSSEIRRCIGEIKIWNTINTLCFSGSQSLIFKNGIWATVVKTYTKEEAEKMLNAKII